MHFLLDAILNMVNNIAANVLGGKPELEGGAATEGTHPSYNYCILLLFHFLPKLSCSKLPLVYEHFTEFTPKLCPVVVMWEERLFMSYL